MKKFKGFAGRLNFTEITALDLGIVKIIQIVKSQHSMSVAQQLLAHVRTNEARAAGDEKVMLKNNLRP